jgi:Zn-dependent peptidase ImmA (M78 family)
MGCGDITRHMERWMESRGILYPSEIDLDWIADKFGIIVLRMPRPSTKFRLKPFICHFVIIDSTCDERQQRVELAHEIAHTILHCGNQLELPDIMRASQECQARRLAHHILAPDYLLIPCLREALCASSNVTRYLADEFRVPIEEMAARLEVLRLEHPHLEVLSVEEIEWGGC